MNIKYSHEFYGSDGVLNRFEILTADPAVEEEVLCSSNAFTLEYLNTRKLDTVRGAQATIRLLSTEVFEFVGLHTDNMQDFLVKFYREGVLCWMGWLDSELYREQLSDTPPYVVEFSAADFNVWERLKYRDSNEGSYTDIVPLITHLKRCLDKLGLPFQNLYIGCSTVPNGIEMAEGETVLHKIYIQSGNFYDEDNEPMTCREVVDSILKPYGLTLIQKGGDVYIYDLNTIYATYRRNLLVDSGTGTLLADEQGRVVVFGESFGVVEMKRYILSDLSYIGCSEVHTFVAKLNKNLFADVGGDYGFEPMINNVTITSSIYADSSLFDEEVTTDTLTGKTTIVDTADYRLDSYTADENYEALEGVYYAYLDKGNTSTNIGYRLIYDNDPAEVEPVLRVETTQYLLSTSSDPSVRIKVGAYANTRVNPFDNTEVTDIPASQRECLALICNLYAVDGEGNKTAFFANVGEDIPYGWISPDRYEEGALRLIYSDKDIKGSDILNKNIINNHVLSGYAGFLELRDKEYQSGLLIPLNMADYWPEMWVPVNGKLVFEITNKSYIGKSGVIGSPAPKNKVKEILINDVSMSLCDHEGNELNMDDFEFKSYINRNVKSDFPAIELKCISANEEGLPIGKGNMLVKNNESYVLHTSFTRAEQTDILERLLMVTIHSNYTRKNQMFSTTIKMTTVNPLGTITYPGILTGQFLITGCLYDFSSATVTINAVEYSQDVDQLSAIPYE